MPLRQFIRPTGLPGAAARIAAACALLLIGAALCPRPAAAQGVVALVNGQPITTLDVEQRARIMEAVSRQRPTRKEVIEDLVNERVKLRQAARLSIEITDEQVERAFAGMARNSGRSSADLNNALRQTGIESKAFKAKLRADLAWREILQQMSPGTFQVRDADVVAALVARGQQLSAKAMQYTLQQVVFIVPRGSPAAVTEKRTREAEALRAKFSDCQADLARAREYSEVVIKDPVIRISTDLPARLQQLLEKTPDGKMTPPETTAAGIEVVAVCGRKETVADLGSRREIRDQLLGSRLEAQEKQILEKLRRQAIIEYK
jgi:peptidyl-prolyl cis-trans isomerase SurA